MAGELRAAGETKEGALGHKDGGRRRGGRDGGAGRASSVLAARTTWRRASPNAAALIVTALEAGADHVLGLLEPLRHHQHLLVQVPVQDLQPHRPPHHNSPHHNTPYQITHHTTNLLEKTIGVNSKYWC